ncbi:MAG: cupin-like domain-containing protein [Asticcacaulis sp.]|uniref:cupin-like domain-containing protein n=1 Tax=Asticcacaulis sp. TaxID=1872648 RepID=UPI003F7C273B
MWLDEARKVESFEGVDRARFRSEIQSRQRPAILKGAVRDWPAVAVAAQGPHALADYFKARANDRKVLFQSIPADMTGRYSFSDDLRGLNHQQRQLAFGDLVNLILRDMDDRAAATHYAGGVPVNVIMPAVAEENRLDLMDPAIGRQVMLWIGNRTRTAAHWDLPQNLACVVAGRRRFTLFPIEQIDNLYITPLDLTLAGQPTSLVDFHAPDFDRFPRFRDAMPHAEVADLEPGDVLYLPSLWFHHVESRDAFGAMINIWWREGPAHLTQTTPLLTLLHGLLTLRDLPRAERMRWRVLFDQYLFQPEAEGAAVAHIPDHARGMFGAMTPETERALKSHLIKMLSR